MALSAKLFSYFLCHTFPTPVTLPWMSGNGWVACAAIRRWTANEWIFTIMTGRSPLALKCRRCLERLKSYSARVEGISSSLRPRKSRQTRQNMPFDKHTEQFIFILLFAVIAFGFLFVFVCRRARGWISSWFEYFVTLNIAIAMVMRCHAKWYNVMTGINNKTMFKHLMTAWFNHWNYR